MTKNGAAETNLSTTSRLCKHSTLLCYTAIPTYVREFVRDTY